MENTDQRIAEDARAELEKQGIANPALTARSQSMSVRNWIAEQRALPPQSSNSRFSAKTASRSEIEERQTKQYEQEQSTPRRCARFARFLRLWIKWKLDAAMSEIDCSRDRDDAQRATHIASVRRPERRPRTPSMRSELQSQNLDTHRWRLCEKVFGRMEAQLRDLESRETELSDTLPHHRRP